VSVSCVFAEEKARIRSALVLGSRAREERGVVYLGGDALSIGKIRSLLDSFLAALWCSRHPKEVQKNLAPRKALSVVGPDARAKKALSFHLVPRRRVFPAGFSVDRPRARPWDASTIAFFGLINSRFSRARAITRPPDQSHFSLTSLDERKRETETERKETAQTGERNDLERERERRSSSYSSYYSP